MKSIAQLTLLVTASCLALSGLSSVQAQSADTSIAPVEATSTDLTDSLVSSEAAQGLLTSVQAALGGGESLSAPESAALGLVPPQPVTESGKVVIVKPKLEVKVNADKALVKNLEAKKDKEYYEYDESDDKEHYVKKHKYDSYAHDYRKKDDYYAYGHGKHYNYGYPKGYYDYKGDGGYGNYAQGYGGYDDYNYGNGYGGYGQYGKGYGGGYGDYYQGYGGYNQGYGGYNQGYGGYNQGYGGYNQGYGGYGKGYGGYGSYYKY